MGNVRQLDADHGDASCQIILTEGGSHDLIARTADVGAMSILSLACALRLEAHLAFHEEGPDRTILQVRAILPAGGDISELSHDVRTGRSTVLFSSGDSAWTALPTVQAVVAASVLSGTALDKSIDPTGELRRAKLDLPSSSKSGGPRL